MANNLQYIGLCYGLKGNDLPPPDRAIRLCEKENIHKLRIYQPDGPVMNLLSEIKIIIGVPNGEIQRIAESYEHATTWFNRNVYPYISKVKLIQYIAVGDGVKPDQPEAQFVVQAMDNIYKLIESDGKNDEIKVSTAIDFQLLALGHFEVPSKAYFIDDGVTRNYIEQICDFIVGHDSQLLANVHPFLAVNKMDTWTVDFALFKEAPKVHDQDANLNYTNLFDLLLDALYTAIANIKQSYQTSLKNIVVSASGWPSAGAHYANDNNAGTYYKNLIAHVPIGTPLKSLQPIETYLFSMYDENQKVPNVVDKHYGIFFPNGDHKYQGVPS